ncbi:XVIPCD domain-containing protein [Lysobacter firmicutimachus]|uniref:XVIPCD domain-containing protein n=1 Tax=Lysobacter firmicutimachus TaxID=1792846 RepID=A0AAU8MTM7_9GAMM
MSNPNPFQNRGWLQGVMDRFGMGRQPQSSAPHQAPAALERPSERVAVELMMDGYEADSRKNIDGWKRLGRDELQRHGVEVDRLQDASTGLDISVYAKGDSIAVNFRGTAGASPKDWGTNIKQHLGLDSAQHDQSVAAVKHMKEVYGENLVVLLGHSKGGGQAMLSSTVTGVPAIVANSASVHENTFAKHGVDINAIDKKALPIKTLNIQGEVLANLQSFSPLRTHQDLGVNHTFPDALIERGAVEKGFSRAYEPGMSMDDDLTSQVFANKRSVEAHFATSMKQVLEVDARQTERAASIAEQAHKGGLARVDNLVEGRDGKSLFAVEGDIGNAAHKRVQIAGGLQGMDTQSLLDKVRQFAPGPSMADHAQQPATQLQTQTGPKFGL